jgi:hypothetical protein
MQELLFAENTTGAMFNIYSSSSNNCTYFDLIFFKEINIVIHVSKQT